MQCRSVTSTHARLAALVLASSVAACGGDDPAGLDAAADGPVDAAGLDAAPVDAPPPRCPPAAGWGAPRPVLSLNTAGDEIYARLTADELTLFGRVADTTLTVSTRPDRDTTFPIGSPLDLGRPTTDFSSPTATGDGLTLYFLAGVGTDPRIWRARRASTSAPFGDVGPVAELASVANVETIYVLPDESAIYISYAFTDRPVQRAGRVGDAFAAPVDVAGIVGTSPVVSTDERTIFFAPGPLATAAEIWMGTRPSTGVPFGSVARVPSIDSPARDAPTWLSPDDCRLYLRSLRAGGSGGWDLYVAERP